MKKCQILKYDSKVAAFIDGCNKIMLPVLLQEFSRFNDVNNVAAKHNPPINHHRQLTLMSAWSALTLGHCRSLVGIIEVTCGTRC